MYHILLSGGTGTRLWPLSNDLRPKQYLKLLPTKKRNSKPESMIQRVWHQLEQVGINNECYICASLSQKELINSQLGQEVTVIEEPEKRDTFAAIVLSCSYLLDVGKVSPEEYVCVLPVDPFADISFFEQLKKLEDCLKKEESDYALLGVCPTYSSSKYGYILPNDKKNGYYTVSSFVEKPTEANATKLIQQGGLWNCGIVCFKLGLIKQKILELGFPMDYKTLYENYHLLPKNSFDYQILEKCSNLIVVPYSGMWKDLGTWSTLTEEMGLDTYGNVVMDSDSIHTSVINELDIPVVVSGVKDLVVVASFDGVLVAEKKNSVNVKQLLSKIDHPAMYEERRWGWIKTLDKTIREGGYSVCKKMAQS